MQSNGLNHKIALFLGHGIKTHNNTVPRLVVSHTAKGVRGSRGIRPARGFVFMKDNIIKNLVIALLSLVILFAIMLILGVRVNPHYFLYDHEKCVSEGSGWFMFRDTVCHRPPLFIPWLNK